MEIKVGEYVRTKEGYIGKLIEYIPNALNYLKIEVGREIRHNDYLIDNYIYTRYGFKLKHSKNIIDLIEIGDYVNNCKVPSRDKNSILLLTDNAQTYLQSIFEDKYIKTILTHEQFEQNCYRLEN